MAEPPFNLPAAIDAVSPPLCGKRGRKAPVNWKGCVWVKKGAPVDVVDTGDEGTEIILRGKSWFADDPLF
jgi:hypothetical protein